MSSFANRFVALPFQDLKDLLPALLCADPKLTNSPIGFLLLGLFQELPVPLVRESLLHGLFEANLVGFQITSYVHHFMQTVSHILALEALPKGIKIEGTFGSGVGIHKGRFGLSHGYRRQSAAGEEVVLVFYGTDPCWRR